MGDERLGCTVALIACSSLDDKLTILLLGLLPSFTDKDEIRMKLEPTLSKTPFIVMVDSLLLLVILFFLLDYFD